MIGNIIGSQNPLTETAYSYEISASGLLGNFGSEYEWYLYKKQKSGSWKDITGTPKKGKKVTYTFGEIALGIEFEMKVYEIKQGILPGMPSSKQLAARLILIPTSNKVPKINKVVLFNRAGKDVNKASYRDTLIAQAHCVAMFNKEIEFHLWEDDAAGKGHDAAVNRNNRHNKTYKARVNEKGIAEVSIPLMTDEKILRQMANRFLMNGDKDEGANHEYYVTASYTGKIQGASQVNVDVANPDYKKGQSPSQPKPKPQNNTPKFPSGQGGGTKQPDPKGNILDAVFINDNGKELSKVSVGDKVRIRIHSKNMVGKHIQYVIWESDTTSHDEVYRSGNIKIPADVCDTSGFVITKAIFDKGIDSPIGDPDSDKQHYFIEIISKDLSEESKKFGVDSDGLIEVEKLKSAAGVQNQPKPEKKGSCICQEQYKDLVWGGKVSCEFRKKVIQICAELWGENRKMDMANGLMAVMNVETASSFKAHQIMGQTLKNVNSITKDDFWLVQKDKKTGKEIRTSRAVGLIQFTQSALQSIGEFTPGSGFDKLHEVKLRFAKMGEVKQLDYVKKYFASSKDKIKSPEDIYLHVFAPKGVNESDHYVLYEKGTIEYTQNASVDTKSKGVNKGDGKIQRSEILERYHDSYNEGKNSKVKTFTCEYVTQSAGKNSNSGFYIYRNGNIKYIEGKNSIAYYVQIKEGSNTFKKLYTLTKNSFGLVKFPDSGDGFNRYGPIDIGGASSIENVGKGDHYLLPQTAAALFGIISEIKDKKWEISLGDMSSENGSDPTSSPSKAKTHHAGHGHKGKQSGLNIDFRYLDKNGKSFQGLSSSSSFDDSKNKIFFEIASKFGFNKNYATGKSYAGVNSKVGGHYDHGHIGALSIEFETVQTIDAHIEQ
ncbi:hypothetical protein DRF59_17330 [Chryseobacterium flavum]|uniref:Phage tail lysozyme domain-containing protein n=1 Tax=Chryseobacterium flavum TaxID=415851 RepID=A0A3D9CHF7_9FLAO|nr:hypothetical protein [Chryseobacterium flavum]REC65213.1 hypothetical protein DRF59_17330 [Chryseobacterium flavum]